MHQWRLLDKIVPTWLLLSLVSMALVFLLAAPLFGEPVTPRKLSGLVAAILAVLAFYQ